MTVADVIAELQRYPQHLPVRVLVSSVIVCDETGEGEIHLSEFDATEATDVRFEGGHVLVSG